MAERIAGIAYVKVDGSQLPLRGNFTVSPTDRERRGIAGQDGFHGFSETPVVPYIEGDVSALPGISIEDIQNITDSTVTAELANGKTYVLSEAFAAGVRELNTGEGSFRLRFEGARCDEF